MATFDVDVGGSTYEVDAPDENTAWKWANQTHYGTDQSSKPRERGYGEEALRQLGLTGRAALEGGVGVLDTLASPMRYGINTLVNPPTSANQAVFGSKSDLIQLPINWDFQILKQMWRDFQMLPLEQWQVERYLQKVLM